MRTQKPGGLSSHSQWGRGDLNLGRLAPEPRLQALCQRKQSLKRTEHVGQTEDCSPGDRLAIAQTDCSGEAWFSALFVSCHNKEKEIPSNMAGVHPFKVARRTD